MQPYEVCPNCNKPWSETNRTTICTYCGIENKNLSIPGKNQCGNCNIHLKAGDMYCRNCGTKVGEGDFLPYWNFVPCVYGPPSFEHENSCANCGYTWTTYNDYYCPKCGNRVSYQRDSHIFD